MHSGQLVALERHRDVDVAMDEVLRIRRRLARSHPEDFFQHLVGWTAAPRC